MKKYRIWITKKKCVDIEAECPSKAIEKSGLTYFWKIECAGRKQMTQEERKKDLHGKFFQAAVISIILCISTPMAMHGVKDVLIRDGVITETESTDFDK